MAAARIQSLKALLGGCIPHKPRAAPEPTRDEVVEPVASESQIEPPTILANIEASHKIKRKPVAAGAAAVISPTDDLIVPVFTPAVPIKGKEDSTQDARIGETSPLGLRFCPFTAVVKWPYKYIDKAYLQPVASAFFDAEKIWNRTWDLYYIWSYEYSTPQPVAFVTSAQFQNLVDEVNNAFPDLKWIFGYEHEERGLVINFSSPNPDLRPRWLGQCSSRERYEFLLGSVLDIHSTDRSASSADITAFKKNLELAANAGKHRSSQLKSELSESIDMGKKQKILTQLTAARRYLRLLDDTEVNKSAASIKQSSDAVLIAIDIEAYERNHNQVTEVGIATLDTKTLQGHNPGLRGQEWHKFIRARHFLISEHRHLVNKAFVKGCPDRFEFGTSEIVSLSDLPKTLASCFRQPYSGTPEPTTDADDKRDIVLVGHAVHEDISYCHQIGFSVMNRSNLVHTLDTSSIYRAMPRQNNKSSLGSIMDDFGLDAWNLHNAGNDAVYTLWALLGMCVGSEAEGKSAAGVVTDEISARSHGSVKQNSDKDDIENAAKGM